MEDVINLDRVSKRLGQSLILKDVTFSVKKGDIFGYLGPNGAGKTTSIRVMLGLFAPTSGKAKILGQDSRSDKVREKVGFVLETDGLYENMSALENLYYYGRIYDIPQLPRRIEYAVGIVGLADRIKDKAGAYSKGMRQRLAIARAILHDPELLILDEPTAGVDPTGQIEIRRIMLDMVHKEGKTILLSSHNLDEVQRICNRIALIHKGQIRTYGELDKLQHDMSHGEVSIETTQPVTGSVVAELKNNPDIAIQQQNGNHITLTTGKITNVPAVVAFLVSRGVGIEQVKKQEASLEEIYTRIIKEAEGI